MFLLNQISNYFYWGMMSIGSFFCHQLSARSPHIAGVQMPLCWRCTGIMIGVFILFLWLIFRQSQPSFLLSCVLASSMLIDVLTAMLGLWNGDNLIRFFTGLLWGVFGANVVLYLLREINKRLANSSIINFTGDDNGR